MNASHISVFHELYWKIGMDVIQNYALEALAGAQMLKIARCLNHKKLVLKTSQ